MTSYNSPAPNERHRCNPFVIFNRFLLFLAVVGVLFASTATLRAQTGGEAGISGTVTDPTGAAVPKATVTATNDATNVSTVRESSGSGLFTISPVIPGTYTVTVKAPGFKTFVQKNLVADALKMTGLNVELIVGSTSSEVEVTSAPPSLDTTSAAIGMTIENDTYANLPLVTNGAMRDPTAFATLAPGTQGGARLPIVGGIGNYLGQLYLDGLPAETINQQADNRVVSQAVSIEAVDQFQEVTSSPPVEYSGAGATNVTMKSGGLKYHGQVSDFIRNTAFDLNGFANKATLVTNAAGQRVFAPKPVDHQNEFSASVGGHIPYTKRVFFFVAYDKFHNRSATNPAQFTIPSALERTGDFTELNGGVGSGGLTGVPGDPSAGGKNPAFLFDPTTNSCSGTTCTRLPFTGLKNGVPTYNVIPANYISPFAQKAQSFLPDVTANNTLTNNYTASLPGGFDNHAIDWRVDFDLNAKQRISTIGAMGAVNYFNNYGSPYLPQPYTGGDLAAIFPKVYDVEHTYTLSNSMVNQFKFGFVRFFMNIQDSTDGVAAYSPTTLGLTNLPAGQAGREFPGMSFATTTKFGTAQQTWTGNGAAVSTQLTTPNNFTLVDNFQYTRGAHSVTAGIQMQWQQINNANPATSSGFLSLPYNANSTANFSGTTLSTAASGYSYASFLLGAVGNTSLSIQPVAETGGRYMPIAPYVSDNWKVSAKFNVDAGLRWDYLPPFHEVLDRWSFLNPTLTNAATGTLGALQFAGNYGGPGVSCGCRTPVQTYWKNFGPRLGITFAPNPTTVFRAGVGHVFSQGGGVGGRAGAANGTGAIGFNTTATSSAEITAGVNAGPSYYLNNSAYFTSIGKANTALFAGNAYPSAPTPGAASQTLNAGNYLNAAGNFVSPSAVSYADPYFSGRAPDFTFYNFGLQQSLTRNLTLAINYVGNQSHHLYNSTAGGGNIRGYWANQLNPVYLAALAGVTNATCDPTQVAKTCSPILSSQATAANIAKAQAAMPGLVVPAFYAAGAAVNGSATIAQALVAFPQYSGVSDTWGVNTANFNYNSLQVSLEQRNFHGLTYNVNYTWSKNVGDDGTFRSGFDIPASAISGGTQSFHQDRIERADTTISQRHVAHAFGVYRLPFGEGRLGGQNVISRQILGGWNIGYIFTYGSGIPLAITSASCTSPGQGQCMPNANPNYAGDAHINGGYGRDSSGARTACAIGLGNTNGQTTGTACASTKYIDATAFQAVPNSLAYLGAGAPLSQLLGNAPRTGAFHLTGPASTNVDANLKRTIKLHDRYNVQLEADVINVANHTIFSNPNVSFGSAAFGTVAGVSNKPRSFQVAAHVNF